MRQIKINFFNRVTIRDRALFTRSLAAMISAGLPLIKSLGILAQQAQNKHFGSVLEGVIKKLEEGEGIAKSLSYYPNVFDRVYISSIQAAESSGKFDEILKDLAEQQEKEYKLNSSVKSALAYPIFIVAAMIVVAVILLITVVPKIQGLFIDLGIKMPITTRILIGTSNFIRSYWYFLVLIVIFLIVWIRYSLKTEKGQEVYGKLQINTFFIKDLFRSIYMARFCRIFGILIGAGVPIVETISLTGSVMDNVVYRNLLLKIADQVQKGVPMSTPLMEQSEFHPILSQMVAVGEQTGKLDEIMASLARFFDDECSKRIGIVTALLEPILLVFIGLGVGVIVFSIIMPIYQISGGIK